MATYKKDPYKPEKDYKNKRNILGQRKSRVSTVSTSDDGTKNTYTTTKTKSISPNRTAVAGPGRTVSSKSRGSDNRYYTQKTNVKTVKNKNVDKFLEKNPGYKVTDGTLKTKTKTVTVKDKTKYPPPASGEYWHKTGEENFDRKSGVTKIESYRLIDVPPAERRVVENPVLEIKKNKTTTRGDVAKARVNKLKALIGIKSNKVKK